MNSAVINRRFGVLLPTACQQSLCYLQRLFSWLAIAYLLVSSRHVILISLVLKRRLRLDMDKAL